MSLRKSKTVDLVIYFEETGSYTLALIIEENLETISDTDFTSLMQRKLQAYAEYILEGRMLKDYPNKKDGQVDVVIKISSNFSRLQKEKLKQIGENLSSYGIPLFYSKIGDTAKKPLL